VREEIGEGSNFGLVPKSDFTCDHVFVFVFVRVFWFCCGPVAAFYATKFGAGVCLMRQYFLFVRVFLGVF
jgi:hypothetical protein